MASPNSNIAAMDDPSSQKVQFKVRAETSFGEVLSVIGSPTELGEWDVEKALPMETSPDVYPTWSTQTAIGLTPGASRDVEFKFIKRSGARVEWETNQNRSILLGSPTRLSVFDLGSFGEPSEPVRSDFFVDDDDRCEGRDDDSMISLSEASELYIIGKDDDEENDDPRVVSTDDVIDHDYPVKTINEVASPLTEFEPIISPLECQEEAEGSVQEEGLAKAMLTHVDDTLGEDKVDPRRRIPDCDVESQYEAEDDEEVQQNVYPNHVIVQGGHPLVPALSLSPLTSIAPTIVTSAPPDLPVPDEADVRLREVLSAALAVSEEDCTTYRRLATEELLSWAGVATYSDSEESGVVVSRGSGGDAAKKAVTLFRGEEVKICDEYYEEETSIRQYPDGEDEAIKDTSDTPLIIDALGFRGEEVKVAFPDLKLQLDSPPETPHVDNDDGTLKPLSERCGTLSTQPQSVTPTSESTPVEDDFTPIAPFAARVHAPKKRTSSSQGVHPEPLSLVVLPGEAFPSVLSCNDHCLPLQLDENTCVDSANADRLDCCAMSPFLTKTIEEDNGNSLEPYFDLPAFYGKAQQATVQPRLCRDEEDAESTLSLDNQGFYDSIMHGNPDIANPADSTVKATKTLRRALFSLYANCCSTLMDSPPHSPSRSR